MAAMVIFDRGSELCRDQFLIGPDVSYRGEAEVGHLWTHTDPAG